MIYTDAYYDALRRYNDIAKGDSIDDI